MQLDQNDINFLKSLFGTDDTRKRFISIVEKFLDELKDIETLPPMDSKDLPEILRQRIDTAKNLRAIIQRLVILSNSPEQPGKYLGI